IRDGSVDVGEKLTCRSCRRETAHQTGMARQGQPRRPRAGRSRKLHVEAAGSISVKLDASIGEDGLRIAAAAEAKILHRVRELEGEVASRAESGAAVDRTDLAVAVQHVADGRNRGFSQVERIDVQVEPAGRI